MPSCPTKYPFAQFVHLSAIGLMHLPFFIRYSPWHTIHCPSSDYRQLSITHLPSEDRLYGAIHVEHPVDEYVLHPSIKHLPFINLYPIEHN